MLLLLHPEKLGMVVVEPFEPAIGGRQERLALRVRVALCLGRLLVHHFRAWPLDRAEPEVWPPLGAAD